MSDSEQAVRCMLLPYSSENLLVPSSAVSEIIGFEQPPHTNIKNSWFLGSVSWRGLAVPVVSLERLCETRPDPNQVVSRMVIISNPNDGSELPYVGFHIFGTPRTYMAIEDELPEGETGQLCKYMLARVQMDGESWLIPNLELILSDLKVEMKSA